MRKKTADHADARVASPLVLLMARARSRLSLAQRVAVLAYAQTCCRSRFGVAVMWSVFYSKISKSKSLQPRLKNLKKVFSKIWVICAHPRRTQICLSLQLRADSSSEEFTRGGGGGLRLRQDLQVLQVLRNLGLPVLLAHLGCPECPGRLECPGCPESLRLR